MEFGAERRFRSSTFGFERGPFEIHPRAIAIERLRQRSHQDACKALLEVGKGPGRRLTRRRGRPLRLTGAPRQLREIADGIEHAHPLIQAHTQLSAIQSGARHLRVHVGEQRVYVGGHKARQIFERAVKRQHFAESRTAQGEVPPVPALRAEKGELPSFEAWTPAFDGGSHVVEQPQTQGGVRQLGTDDANRHRASPVV